MIASLGGEYEVVLIARADGAISADVRPLVRLSVQVIAEANGRRETAPRRRRAHRLFALHRRGLDRYARQAVSQALVNLEARPAPAGTMTVVLGPGWPGVLPARGGGRPRPRGRLQPQGQLGFRAPRPAGRLARRHRDRRRHASRRRGSLSVDDEGTPTRSVLIEDGVLRGYMQDSLNARLLGMPLTATRAASRAHITLPRMTNTYMLAGPRWPRSSRACRGASTPPLRRRPGRHHERQVRVSAAEAYLIENGKVTHPVKGATLIGNGPDALTRVTMIGRDLELDPGIGTCGKEGRRAGRGRT